VAFVVIYSFGYKPPQGAKGAVRIDRLSLDNYSDVWDKTFRRVFANTMLIAGAGTLLCAVIAMPVAYFVAVKAGPKLRGLLLVLIIVPFWMSFFVRTLAWRIVLAANGLLSNFLIDHGLRETKISFLDTKGAVLLAVVYNYLPLMIFPLFVSLDRIEPALREASKDLGAGRLTTFLSVTLPLAAPGLSAGALLVFIPLAGDFVTATVLGGAKGNMIGRNIYSFVIEAQNLPKGAAAAVLLIVMILLMIALAAVVVGSVQYGLHRRRRVELGVVG
jgi:spermidine/putrescine transport system permease protein